MKAVTVTNLPVGSYLDKPVFLDEKYILLSPDIPVAQDMKTRLQTWGYSKVFTDGVPAEAPPDTGQGAVSALPDGASSAIITEDVKDKERMAETVKFFIGMNNFLAQVFKRFLEKNEFSISTISEKIKEMIAMVKARKKYILRLAELNSPEHNYIISQSVKTTIIALLLGDVLKLPIFKQIELGTAALLHEIGMLRLPPQLYLSNKSINPEDKKKLDTHTIIGFRILKEASFSMMVCRAVLEVHERVDGSGYPRQLTGEKIAFFAKVIAVSSSYVAIVSDRPFREKSDGHSGMMNLLKNAGKLFDEQVMKVLVFTLSIYPIGTYVLLSSGAKGIVMETDPGNPRHPIVRLLVNELDAPFREQPLLHTGGTSGINVSRPLSKKEIESLENVK
ncbi:MAG: HD domain-containing protein [Spirochaetales bacterium]|nr:MAG: HD domain-containing protein [Spirochaetales bacterium]